jgi:S-DNA-T family DNA segregation ATPase FtsK/SpoIIIE
VNGLYQWGGNCQSWSASHRMVGLRCACSVSRRSRMSAIAIFGEALAGKWRAMALPRWQDRSVPCGECGFVYDEVAREDLAFRLRSGAASFRARFEAALPVAAVTTRPEPSVWSVLEYGCHVRDVLIVQRERVLLALVEERPTFVPMYRDERAVLAAYTDEPARSVAAGIEPAAMLLAHLFEHLTSEQFERLCIYVYPEPRERDLLWVGRHTVHECQHHLHDIDRQL